MTGMDRAGDRSLYYLVVPAGYPNYGDELIAAGWLRYLAEHAPDADVWVDTHSPGPAAVLHSGLHPRVRFTDTLWRLCWQAPSEQPWEVASWVRSAVRDPGMAPRWGHGIDLLAEADVVHVLGGGYVNGVWPRHVGVLAAALEGARRSGGRVAMTGQGLMPVAENAGPLVRTLADQFDVVDVRDEASAELVGVDVGADDAFLGLTTAAHTEDDLPEIMLCLQSDLVVGDMSALAAAALSMLRAWKVDPARVGIVEGIPRVDREVYAMLEHELPGARFYPFRQVWDEGLPVAAGQTWISTRFHPHLVAAAAGASGVAVSVHPEYYGAKHRALASLGSQWTLVEEPAAVVAGSVPDRPVGGGFDPATVDSLRAGKELLAQSVYAPVIRPEPDRDEPAHDEPAHDEPA